MYLEHEENEESQSSNWVGLQASPPDAYRACFLYWEERKTKHHNTSVGHAYLNQSTLVAISIAPRRPSHALIEETKEFVVNIPTMGILKETLFCGRASGRDHDKFKEAGLTRLRGRKVKAPAIKNALPTSNANCTVKSPLATTRYS
jgi:hypothetical protein